MNTAANWKSYKSFANTQSFSEPYRFANWKSYDSFAD